MALRAQNERRFKRWEELPKGGRRYVRADVAEFGLRWQDCEEFLLGLPRESDRFNRMN